MADFIEISPSQAETGIPLTVSIHDTQLESKSQFLLISKGSDSPNRAELVEGPNGTKMAQFVLYKEGDYQLEIGTHKKLIHVSARRDISFFLEVGFLVISVLLLLGGLIIWNQKRQKSKVGFS